VGLAREEFITKVLVGLETHTFDIGNMKHVAKYQKSFEAISNHIQTEYKGLPEIAKAIRELSLPTIPIPNYPTANSGGTSTQEKYPCGNKTSKNPRRESSCSLRTRSAHMPSLLDSAWWSLAAKSRDWTHTSKPTPTRMWSNFWQSSKTTAATLTTASKAPM
jgi:hypothetical protein